MTKFLRPHHLPTWLLLYWTIPRWNSSNYSSWATYPPYQTTLTILLCKPSSQSSLFHTVGRIALIFLASSDICSRLSNFCLNRRTRDLYCWWHIGTQSFGKGCGGSSDALHWSVRQSASTWKDIMQRRRYCRNSCSFLRLFVGWDRVRGARAWVTEIQQECRKVLEN